MFAWESRFAPPPIACSSAILLSERGGAPQTTEEDEDSALVGESPGVGGCDATTRESHYRITPEREHVDSPSLSPLYNTDSDIT